MNKNASNTPQNDLLNQSLTANVTALGWLSELFNVMLEQPDNPNRIKQLCDLGRYVAEDIASLSENHLARELEPIYESFGEEAPSS